MIIFIVEDNQEIKKVCVITPRDARINNPNLGEASYVHQTCVKSRAEADKIIKDEKDKNAIVAEYPIATK